MSDDKANEPMDKTAREGEAVMHKASPRNVYAMDQLLSEVEHLFPGVAYEVSHRNARGVAFDVQFDLSTIVPEDRGDFVTLLSLLGDPAYNEDRRIESLTADEEYVLISFRNNPIFQDDRAAFGLEQAWAVIREVRPSAGILYIPEGIEFNEVDFRDTMWEIQRGSEPQFSLGQRTPPLSFPGGFDAEHDGPGGFDESESL